ncbi:FG-GAP repeat protein [Botrimarina colliarenosi]|uniref:FG-GAP repeat protein n=1 Tax=Botrimarina colliarenosi TaxID=2528001 RepID=A0A5C6AEF7_9BACT|nr:FG-GAP-like repeat-containing protein [Botrimarina colliarenosi]TWT97565.1 FG-GAP repeat protein [Botrimarina colliarenosi]
MKSYEARESQKRGLFPKKGSSRHRSIGRAGHRRKPLFELLEDRRLLAADFGDAGYSYPTALVDNGARHTDHGPGSLRLGLEITAEPNGQASWNADTDAGDDGVVFGELYVGQLGAEVSVTVSNAPAGAKLDAWIDFNSDRSWSDDEHVFASVPVVEGLNTLTLNVPTWATWGKTYSRFRLSTAGDLDVTGLAEDGEVEDYYTLITLPTDRTAAFADSEIVATTLGRVETFGSADIDSDGDVDLIVSESVYNGTYFENRLNWYYGNGPSYAVRLIARTSDQVRMIEVADIDADGDMDLLVAFDRANSTAGGVSWYENDGNQNFSRHTIQSGPRAYDASLADIDGDGDLDVLTSLMTWYEHDGEGNFTSAGSIPSTLEYALSVDASDLDRDGDLDILVATSDGRIAWFEFNGVHLYTQKQVASGLGTYGLEVRPIDMDGDGYLDIFPEYTSKGGVGWYRNDGLGGFDWISVSGSSDTLKSHRAADFDGDGDIDIVSSHSGGETVWYERNDAQSYTERLAGELTYDIRVSDFDTDGDVDIIAIRPSRNVIRYTDDLLWLENKPAVHLSLPVNPASEEVGPSLAFDFFIDAPRLTPLVLSFSIEGTANVGRDFTLSGYDSFDGIVGSITIPAGETSAVMVATPVDDASAEVDESIVVTLLPTADYQPSEAAPSIGWLVGEESGEDFGDAPAPYPSLSTEDGARHSNVGVGELRLGSDATYEAEGQHTESADSDLGDDGIAFGPIHVGQGDASIEVTVSNALVGAKIDGWIDFNGDGSWGGANERIFASRPVTDGVNYLTFEVPAWATPGSTYARFRLSTAGGLGVTGFAEDGEVEDYMVVIDPASAQPIAFDLGVTIDGDTYSLDSIFTIDVDGDGDLDILSAASGSNRVAWHENDGAGNFVRHTLDGAANDAHAIIATDLDSDGDIDVVVTEDGTSDEVNWYENIGGQTFTRRSIATGLQDVRDVTAADIDGDDDIDLLVASPSRIWWLENDGANDFTPRDIADPADGASSVQAADFDRDGDIDVISTSLLDDKVVWYENKGTLSFTRHTISSAADFASKALTADVDRDGDLDVITVSYSNSSIAWYQNDGEQNFTKRIVSDTIKYVSSLFIADVTGDGWVDIVTGNVQFEGVPNAVVLFVNQQDGEFVEQIVADNPRSVRDVVVADINGDGDLDIVASLYFRSDLPARIEWYENIYNATLTSGGDPLVEGSEPWALEFQIPEVRDQPTELAFSVSGAATSGADYELTGAASFDGVRGTVVIPAGALMAGVSLTPLDDGLFELNEVVTVSLLKGPGDNAGSLVTQTNVICSTDVGASFGDAPAPYPTLLADNGARHAHVGDETLRLGELELASPDGTPSSGADQDAGDDGVVFGEIRVGQLDAQVTVTVSNAPAGARLDAWIDFNGDGNWSGGDERVFTSVPVVEGVNLLTFDVPVEIASSVATFARFRLSTAGDLGPTGLADDGEVEDYAVSILPPALTNGAFGEPAQLLPPSQYLNGATLQPIDFDGDGDLDIVGLANSIRTLFWYENEAGVFSDEKIISSYTTHFSVVDFDGDGDLDIVKSDYNGFDSNVSWLENAGDQTFEEHFLAKGSVFAVADVNKDGRLDVVTYAIDSVQYFPDFAVLTWYINDGAGGYETSEVFRSSSFVSRIGANDLQTADLNGDGLLDVVVAGSNSPFGELVAFFGVSDGQYSVTTLDGSRAFSATPIDMDQDGDIDLVVQFERGAGWLENDGAGEFTSRSIGGGPNNSNDIAIADFDGDGDIDVVNASHRATFTPSRFTLFANDGSQRFVGATIEPDGTEPYHSLFVADMDGNGTLDLVAAGPNQGMRLYSQTLRPILTSEAPTVVPENGNDFVVGVELQAAPPEAISVPFTVSGDAVLGVDYLLTGADSMEGSSGVLTIPAGVRRVDLTVVVLTDAEPELFESIIISIGDEPRDRLIRWIAADGDAGDFGDAPEPFPIEVEQLGAAHVAVGPRLGDTRTTEPQGAATAHADGDSGDDGVTFGPVVVGSSLSSMTVDVQNAPTGAFVDVWIDFNGDGVWSGELEQVFASRPVVEGANTLQFEVPSWATNGTTYARVRLSSTGGLGVRGNALDGEVEDYQLTIASPLGGLVDYEIAGVGVADTPYAAVKTIDFDRDGRTDLIAAGSGSDPNVYWLRNEGGGEFSTHLLAVVDYGMRDLAIDDVDGDGDWDVVVASQPSTIGSRLVLLQNDGANNFNLSVIASNVEGSRSVMLVDLDGDGTKDLVAGGYRGNQLSTSIQAGEIAWYKNDGSGNFSSSVIDRQLGPVVNVGVADLDGDGDLDLYTSAMNVGTLLMYRNNGDSTFTKELIVETQQFGSQLYVGGRVRAADFDGDGDLDLAMASSTFRPLRVVWYENDGAGAFVERVVDAGQHYYNDILPADLDGDGDLDLVLAFVPGAPGDRPTWIEARIAGDANNDGVVDLDDQAFWRASYGATSGPGLVADLTGDGAVNAADYTVWRDAYESGVASIVYLPRFASWTFDATSLGAADFDGDRDLDLIAVTSTGIVLASNSSFQPIPPAISEPPSESTSAFSAAAINWSVIAKSPPSDRATPRRRYTAPPRPSDYDRSIALLSGPAHQQKDPMALQAIDKAFADATEPAMHDGHFGLTVSEETPFEGEMRPWGLGPSR